MGRAAAAPGFADWTGRLAAGASRNQVVSGFAQSVESTAHFAAATSHLWVADPVGALIDPMYEVGFGRTPDAGGVATDSQALAGGLGAAGMATAIAASTEFQALHAGHGTAQLLASVYQSGLDRAPDATGLRGWTAAPNAGGSVAGVLLGIATAPETAAHLSPGL